MFAITNYVLQLWLQQSKVWLVSGIPAHCRWSFILFFYIFTVSCVLSLNVFRNKPAELEYTFYLTYKLHPIFLKSVSCNYRQRYIFKFWIDREKVRSLSGFYCCLYFCFEVWGHGGASHVLYLCLHGLWGGISSLETHCILFNLWSYRHCPPLHY